MAPFYKTAASCFLLVSLLPLLLPFLALALSIFVLFVLPLASAFLSFSFLHKLAKNFLASELHCQNAPSLHLPSNHASHQSNPDGFMYTNAYPEEQGDQPAAVMLLAASDSLAPDVSCDSQWEPQPDDLQESTEKLVVCKPELFFREESFDGILTSDPSLHLDEPSFVDAGQCLQVLDEPSLQIPDSEMEGTEATAVSQFPHDSASDDVPPEAEGLSVEEGSKFNDELTSEDQADTQPIDVKLMDRSGSLDAHGSELFASAHSSWDDITQENAPAMSVEQDYTEQFPNGSTEIAQSNGFLESESMEKKEEDFRADTSSCATSLTEAIEEPIVDASIEVKSRKEMTLLSDINEIKQILGCNGDSQASLVEQIRALYNFVGITPSHVGDMDELEMARVELEVLRAIIGVEAQVQVTENH